MKIANAFFLMFFLAWGCKTALPRSEPAATAKDEALGLADRTRIYNELHAVMVDDPGIFRRIVEVGLNPNSIPMDGDHVAGVNMARRLAQNAVQMLENLMRSGTDPIHPVAFFATIKDFETAADFSWYELEIPRRKAANRYHQVANMCDPTCYSLFQIDGDTKDRFMNTGNFRSRDPHFPALLQSMGLNLWGKRGAADFALALFWWTTVLDGNKCRAIVDFRANPCLDSGFTWTLEHVNDARLAYGQLGQWGTNSWQIMYGYYKDILLDDYMARGWISERSIVDATRAFKERVGLSPRATPGQ